MHLCGRNAELSCNKHRISRARQVAQTSLPRPNHPSHYLSARINGRGATSRRALERVERDPRCLADRSTRRCVAARGCRSRTVEREQADRAVAGPPRGALGAPSRSAGGIPRRALRACAGPWRAGPRPRSRRPRKCGPPIIAAMPRHTDSRRGRPWTCAAAVLACGARHCLPESTGAARLHVACWNETGEIHMPRGSIDMAVRNAVASKAHGRARGGRPRRGRDSLEVLVKHREPLRRVQHAKPWGAGPRLRSSRRRDCRAAMRRNTDSRRGRPCSRARLAPGRGGGIVCPNQRIATRRDVACSTESSEIRVPRRSIDGTARRGGVEAAGRSRGGRSRRGRAAPRRS